MDLGPEQNMAIPEPKHGVVKVRRENTTVNHRENAGKTPLGWRAPKNHQPQ